MFCLCFLFCYPEQGQGTLKSPTLLRIFYINRLLFPSAISEGNRCLGFVYLIARTESTVDELGSSVRTAVLIAVTLAERAVYELSLTGSLSKACPAVESTVGSLDTLIQSLVAAKCINSTCDCYVLQNDLFRVCAVVVDEDTAERTCNSKVLDKTTCSVDT